MVIRSIILVCGFWLAVEPAIAQLRTESPGDNVRRRQAEKRSSASPYWEGFILKHEGKCSDAVSKLTPLARLGVGYEDAQTALGECYLQLAGLTPEAGAVPQRTQLAYNDNYKTGLDWISTAANAGHFEAQGIMVALYAAGLGPTQNEVEGAEWAHLYLTNPSRLNLGAPVLAERSINALKESMSAESWLVGKQNARKWVPVYGLPADKK